MTLPTPEPIAQAHSGYLLGAILDEIRAEGPMSFERYMQMALYAPGLGYYSAGARKFGESGDFVTAPEISSLFSRCLAKQVEQVLSQIPEGVILELGAGTGVMARDILLELNQRKELPEKYYILEVSADLRDRQQALLRSSLDPVLFSKLEWLTQWPSSIRGVVLANEVLDAMPVRRFCFDGELLECFVTEKKNQLSWLFEKPSDELKKAFLNIDVDLPSPYLSEINCLLPGWFASLHDALKEGVAFFIDYGFPQAEYYHPDRREGTLMCHYQHRAHSDPLMLPGIQDITAHVDFTAVEKAAKGFDLLGYTNQALFLLGCGIDEFMLNTVDVKKHLELAQQIKKLTLPTEMGELFKVIALGKGFSDELMGFQVGNQIERLR